LRRNKGSLVWVSSGAANMSLAAWGTYSSSKAAVNALVAHYAVEEPDVSSIAINPGRVDTDMQATIRDQGKASMNQSQHDNFVAAFETGELLKPEQPGSVIARLAVEPAKELSGRFLRYVASKPQTWYRLLTRQQLGFTRTGCAPVDVEMEEKNYSYELYAGSPSTY
jgi:NAD(P)-dependent dehydrogenase (short-subunit alcohol dehydrogenase family)